MTPPLENGRARSRKTDEDFVLFLQGIPAHCRWQELKDLVRQTALHIRQAVVYDDQHGFPTGLGQIIVKHEEAAWRTFRAQTLRKRLGRPEPGRDAGADKLADASHRRTDDEPAVHVYRVCNGNGVFDVAEGYDDFPDVSR
ncbi:hypothetical protein PHISP_07404, partial [Aspergillus sp. HF37]